MPWSQPMRPHWTGHLCEPVLGFARSACCSDRWKGWAEVRPKGLKDRWTVFQGGKCIGLLWWVIRSEHSLVQSPEVQVECLITHLITPYPQARDFVVSAWGNRNVKWYTWPVEKRCQQIQCYSGKLLMVYWWLMKKHPHFARDAPDLKLLWTCPALSAQPGTYWDIMVCRWLV